MHQKLGHTYVFNDIGFHEFDFFFQVIADKFLFAVVRQKNEIQTFFSGCYHIAKQLIYLAVFGVLVYCVSLLELSLRLKIDFLRLSIVPPYSRPMVVKLDVSN